MYRNSAFNMYRNAGKLKCREDKKFSNGSIICKCPVPVKKRLQTGSTYLTNLQCNNSIL